MREREESAYLAHLDLAQTPVILASGPSGLGTGFLVSALIKEQHAALLERRCPGDLSLHLPEDEAGIPGGVRHEVLDVLW
jgi:hypothetical protein